MYAPFVLIGLMFFGISIAMYRQRTGKSKWGYGGQDMTPGERWMERMGMGLGVFGLILMFIQLSQMAR
jgi:hypothetical protein